MQGMDLKNLSKEPNTWGAKQRSQHEWAQSVQSRTGSRTPCCHCSVFEIVIFENKRSSCKERLVGWAARPTCAKVRFFSIRCSAKQLKHSTCIGRSLEHEATGNQKWICSLGTGLANYIHYCCLSDTTHLCSCKFEGRGCFILHKNFNKCDNVKANSGWKVAGAVLRMNPQGLGARCISLNHCLQNRLCDEKDLCAWI